MTIEELKNARAIYLLICTYIDELNEHRVLAYSTPISLYSEHIGTSDNQSRTENAVIKLVEYENKIREKMAEYIDEKEKISDAIDKIADLTERAILRMRYINGKSIKEIEQAVGYGRAHIYRIHDEAIEKLKS